MRSSSSRLSSIVGREKASEHDGDDEDSLRIRLKNGFFGSVGPRSMVDFGCVFWTVCSQIVLKVILIELLAVGGLLRRSQKVTKRKCIFVRRRKSQRENGHAAPMVVEPFNNS